MTARYLRMLFAALVAGILCLVASGAADAFIYWPTGSSLTVGRANLDGTSASYDAYPHLDTETCSVAVDSGHVYYGGRFLNESIGRVPLTGGGAPQNLIDGVSSPCGLAIFGHYIYWTNDPDYYSTGTGSIGRASLTGAQDIHQDFITNATGAAGPIDHPCGLTVNAEGIFWTNSSGGAIGHANLDGTNATTMLAGAQAGCSITQAAPYLYWDTAAGSSLSPDGTTIARSLMDGSAADLTWGTNLGSPCGLASYSHYLFFGAAGGVIDRIDTESPSLRSSETQLVQGQGSSCGVAVDGLYQGTVTAARARPLRDGGVALSLILSNPGRVSVHPAPGAPALLAPMSTGAVQAGTVVLHLRPTLLAMLRLRHHRRLITTLAISYTPTGGIGGAASVTASVTR